MRFDMDHIVLNATDVEVMLAFYSTVLQLTIERVEEYRQGIVPFPSVRLNDNTVIDLFPKKLWQKVDANGHSSINLNHFCLALSKSDWEILLISLKTNGTKIIDGPVTRWGAHGSGISIYFHDPEGNLVEARYYQEQHISGKCLLGS